MESKLFPLTIDSTINKRYKIQRLLGKSHFAYTYLARDFESDDLCVIKELAPFHGIRDPDQQISYPNISNDSVFRLRRLFIDQAAKLRAVNHRCLIPIRDLFCENNTAYYVRYFIPELTSLSHVTQNSNQVNSDVALNWIIELTKLLEELSAERIFHRNIKPSNIQIDLTSNSVYLIDFQHSQEWYADLTESHGEIFNHVYSAPEQKKINHFRSEATDIHSLSKCFLEYLNNSSYDPSDQLKHFAEILYQNSFDSIYERHPCYFTFLKSLLKTNKVISESEDLDSVTKKIGALQKLKTHSSECPSCHGVLEKPVQLKPHQCPCCHENTLEAIHYNSNSCPECFGGVLKTYDLKKQFLLCPSCTTGLLKKCDENSLCCSICSIAYTKTKQGYENQDSNLNLSVNEWAERSNRSYSVLICDSCNLQFDVLPDNQALRYHQDPKSFRKRTRLYPEEWARIAAKRSLNAGNYYCRYCQSSFHKEKDHTTIVEPPKKISSRFANDHLNQLLTNEFVRSTLWTNLKSSHILSCRKCTTEFECEDSKLKLMHTLSVNLSKYVNQTESLADWHRISNHLPHEGHENELFNEVEALSRIAYQEGLLNFDSNNTNLVWKGKVRVFQSINNQSKLLMSGDITISDQDVICQQLFHKLHFYLDEITQLEHRHNLIFLNASNYDHQLILRIEPVKFKFQLGKFKAEAELGEEDLYIRLKAMIQLTQEAVSLSGT
jgi:serine/threonine protein kinase